MPTTNPIDLTTLGVVKSWAGVLTPGDDVPIQDAITAFSAYVLHLTDRGPADGSIPAHSPFVEVVTYDELYDGNGNDTLPLRNWPIASITSVNDSGLIVQPSTSLQTPGWVVDQSKKFLVLRLGGSAYAGLRRGTWARKTGWSLGTQNIEIVYTAGFAAIPFDLEMTARKVVSLNYKRRQRIDQKSQAMAQGAGTVSFYDWEMDAADKRTIDFYSRRVA